MPTTNEDGWSLLLGRQEATSTSALGGALGAHSLRQRGWELQGSPPAKARPGALRGAGCVQQHPVLIGHGPWTDPLAAPRPTDFNDVQIAWRSEYGQYCKPDKGLGLLIHRLVLSYSLKGIYRGF